MRLTRETMWERMMASDSSFNGRFFTGVHSTGIYCLPSCHARKPKPENVRFYHSADKAEKAGLRPCKKCRPDEFAKGVDTELDRLVSVVESVRANPDPFKSVDDVAYTAAMSSSALFASLRTHFHTSPGSLLSEARITKAKSLLREGTVTAAEAGIAVGFDSTSAFYDNFGRATGMPPAQYRRLATSSDFSMELPADYHPDTFLSWLGRDPESRTERVEGNRFTVGLWAGDEPVVVRGRFDNSRLYVCREHGGGSFEVHHQIVRLLGLAQDPAPFEEHVRSLGLEALVADRRGLRIPQTATPFDGLVWSIVGQQVNLAFACALRRRLAEIAGVRLTDGFYAPPTPARVASLTIEELVPLQYSRRKAEYLIDAARAVVDGTINFDALSKAPPARVESALLAVRGIGPWSANYLMMRALGLPDCLPLGDTGLTSGLARLFEVPRPDPAQTINLMARFRPYRSLATYHLWRSLAAVTDG
jgi:AraC family transcriptional regulator, regulatory protein of adaptative response / DNA-3-methyladenine glycosylase II